MRAFLLAWTAAALLPLACEDSGLVGGECRPGACDGTGGDAGADVSLDGMGDAGADGDTDGDLPDGTLADRPDVDSDAPDGTTGDGGDGAPGDGAPGDGQSDAPPDGCTPPYNTPAQCGDCFTACTSPTPICAPVDGSFACVPLCTPPFVDCGGVCVDLNSDPNHCGACNNKCPSGICQGGTCVGAVPGHVVAMCMSYDTIGQTAPQTTLLGNAVFLSPKNPVRIMAYQQHANNGNVNKVNQVIAWAAAAKGRTFTLLPTSNPNDIVTGLSTLTHEVLLVYDQPNAPASALGPIGSSWQNTLDQFTKAGGTVIVLDGNKGTAQMNTLLTSAGLLDVTLRTDVTNDPLYNKAPADAVGLNVLSPFVALKETCTFTTTTVPGSLVNYVIDAVPAPGPNPPVVVHRIKVP